MKKPVLSNMFFLVFLFVGVGCSPSTMLYQQQAAPRYGIVSGAGHLNQVADPSLPAVVYQNCTAGEWSMKAAANSEEGNTFYGHSSQHCAPQVTRGRGYNPYSKNAVRQGVMETTSTAIPKEGPVQEGTELGEYVEEVANGQQQ